MGIINTRGEINEYKTDKTIEKIAEIKSFFFENVDKINKTLARLIKKKKREDANYKYQE